MAEDKPKRRLQQMYEWADERSEGLGYALIAAILLGISAVGFFGSRLEQKKIAEDEPQPREVAKGGAQKPPLKKGPEPEKKEPERILQNGFTEKSMGELAKKLGGTLKVLGYDIKVIEGFELKLEGGLESPRRTVDIEINEQSILSGWTDKWMKNPQQIRISGADRPILLPLLDKLEKKGELNRRDGDEIRNTLRELFQEQDKLKGKGGAIPGK